jgi:bacteriocin biosynthesis cyclodehydratase domain-containing protein
MNAPQRLPVHIISVGPFGRAVAQNLRGCLAEVQETEVGLEELLPRSAVLGARVNIVAAWRPVPQLCEVVDQLSHEMQKPFVPLVVDATLLQIGPVVIPRQGSCWQCWMRRSAQPSPLPKERLIVQQYYLTHPDAGPKGYLEPFALLGALRIKQIVEGIDSSDVTPGSVWQFDMITRQITRSIVTGIHNCPRCGLHREAPARTFAQMKQDLAYLWKQTAKGERGSG